MNDIQKKYVDKMIETSAYRSLYSRFRKNVSRIMNDFPTGTIDTLIGKFIIVQTKSTYISVKKINNIIHELETINPNLKDYGKGYFQKVNSKYVVDLTTFRESEIYKNNLALTQSELIKEAETAVDDIKDNHPEYTLCKYVYMMSICKIYSDEFLENYNLLLNNQDNQDNQDNQLEYNGIIIRKVYKKPLKKIMYMTMLSSYDKEHGTMFLLEYQRMLNNIPRKDTKDCILIFNNT